MTVAWIIVGAFLGALVMYGVQQGSESSVEKENEKLEDRLKRLRQDLNFWHGKAISNACELDKIKGQITLYEKIANKFLCDQDSTDSIFMFEGGFYYPVSFNLSRNPGEADTLDVGFVAADIKKEVKYELNN